MSLGCFFFGFFGFSRCFRSRLAERAFANQTYGSLFDMPVPALSLEAIDEFTSIINFEGYATTAPSMSPAPTML